MVSSRYMTNSAALCFLFLCLGVLSEKHHDRSTRVYTIVLEAFSRLLWEQSEASTMLTLKKGGLQLLKALCTSVSPDSVQALIENPDLSFIHCLYYNFVRNDLGPTAEYWQSYCSTVKLILPSILTTHEGNWELHLQCIRYHLPCMFAYDRIK